MAHPSQQDTAFPTLDDHQIDALARCAGAAPKTYRDGKSLFRAGDRDVPFFVVKSGAIAIVDGSGGSPKEVALHLPGGFSGDVSHMTGTSAVISAVARGETQVIAVAAGDLRRALNDCPGLSDVILGAFIARRAILRDSGEFTGLRVIGSRYSKDTFRIRDFLSRNRVLFTWRDLEDDPEVDHLLRDMGLCETDTPVVSCGGKLLLKNPSDVEIARAIGVLRPVEDAVYDLAIVGAGPAGLAAAVYGASEGLSTVVLERTAPGGQAGSSMRIENYLGFPTGITGADLADRATLQAGKFGAKLAVPSLASSLSFDANLARLCLDSGQVVSSRCLLIATGADYRKLDAEGCGDFEGRGVYYAATPNEVQMCKGARVIVVGGGNSAGQAAVFLAAHASEVLLVIRGADLARSMSSYLIHRIEHTPNIRLLARTSVGRMSGNGHLDSVDLVSAGGPARPEPVSAVFSFLGAVPRTGWLPREIETDAKGFVATGPLAGRSASWTLHREPFLMETTRPGVFAAGDVRSGSVKRVASAVGEGSMAVQFVHEYLKEA